MSSASSSHSQFQPVKLPPRGWAMGNVVRFVSKEFVSINLMVVVRGLFADNLAGLGG